MYQNVFTFQKSISTDSTFRKYFALTCASKKYEEVARSWQLRSSCLSLSQPRVADFDHLLTPDPKTKRAKTLAPKWRCSRILEWNIPLIGIYNVSKRVMWKRLGLACSYLFHFISYSFYIHFIFISYAFHIHCSFYMCHLLKSCTMKVSTRSISWFDCSPCFSNPAAIRWTTCLTCRVSKNSCPW